MSLLPLRDELIPFLQPYLPDSTKFDDKPYITLTYAQSLDSRISKGNGLKTIISHDETKTMTHYLRFVHDSILVGSGTVLTDNPGLNCRWYPEGASPKDLAEISPRPIILDISCKWSFEGSKIQELYNKNEGKSPIIVVAHLPEKVESGVEYLVINTNSDGMVDWKILFQRLRDDYGLKSIMVEGGAIVINSLLKRPDLIKSLIITVGTIFLGSQGVEVSPVSEVGLKDVSWWNGTRDSVMCARLSD